jgi:capsular exopolysaccharide synthesis family protein
MVLANMFATSVRRWLVVAAAGVVGLLLGAGYSLTAAPTYEASSAVLLSLDSGDTVSELAEGSNYTQQMAPSFAEVATMPIVLDSVIEQLGLSMTASQLKQRIDVDLPAGGVVMRIKVESRFPEQASAIADAVAGQLISTVSTLSGDGGKDSVHLTLSLVSSAVTPTAASSPNLPVDLAVGTVLGVVLSIGLLVGSEVMSSAPVRDRKSAMRAGSATVLGSIVEDRKSKQRPLPVSTHPYLPRAEGFRMLLTGLQLVRSSREPLCMVMASTVRGEGTTSTAANLAVALCHTDKRVLLVDANLRHPGVAGVLGMDGRHGLTSVLSGRARWQDVVQPWETQIWGERRLSVLPAGTLPENPSEMLDSPAMRDLMAELRAAYDVILFDAPALLSVADGSILASQSDGALVVIDVRRARQRQVSEAVGRLRMAQATVLGLVLNREKEDPGTASAAPAPSARLPRQMLHGNRG